MGKTWDASKLYDFTFCKIVLERAEISKWVINFEIGASTNPLFSHMNTYVNAPSGWHLVGTTGWIFINRYTDSRVSICCFPSYHRSKDLPFCFHASLSLCTLTTRYLTVTHVSCMYEKRGNFISFHSTLLDVLGPIVMTIEGTEDLDRKGTMTYA